jgi:hypothetical protein
MVRRRLPTRTKVSGTGRSRETRTSYVYSDETPGREFIDQAEAALAPDGVARAREVGRRVSIKEALDLARVPQSALA